MKKKLFVAFAGIAVASACSVSQETTPAQVELDGTVAKSQASALSTAAASAEANDGVSIAQALASIGDTAAALVPQAKEGGQRRIARTTTTCTCAAATKSCSFAGCTIGNATLTGSLSWADGHITCSNVVVDVAATSATVGAAHVTLACALSYTSATIEGDLHTTGQAVVDGVTYGWDASVSANDVTFTKAAFTGGSVDVHADVTMTSKTEAEKSFTAAAVVALP